MSLDCSAQDLRVDLCRLDVLVSQHTGDILNRHIMRQCHRREAVPCDVESQLLADVQLHLYHMEVVVNL